MSRNFQLIQIGTRIVGRGQPLFVIAEIGLNHGGSVARALQLVDAAADAGASAIKLQTLDADHLVAADAPPPAHVPAGSMREFFSTFELDEAAHLAVVTRARRRGMAVLATPLSEPAVDMLVRVGVDALKIASGDLTWERLITKCASTRLPIVMSTGMATLEETARALDYARRTGARDIALLHCVSAYPVPSGSENLRAIEALARSFWLPVGLSDHGADGFALPLAVAAGASLYERHIVLSKNDGSIDAAVSSDPRELAALVRTAASVNEAMGSGQKECLPVELPNRTPSRRGLYAARALRAGDIVRPEDVVALRPERGLPAHREAILVGTRLNRNVDAGAPFAESDLYVS